MNLDVKNLDHLGIVAGIVDEIALVEIIDEQSESNQQQIVSTGQVVKAMILNGLGFVSAPMYLFSAFFEGKATEHLLGAGIEPKHLNDDRLGRALDALWKAGLSRLFTLIAMSAYQVFSLLLESVHLDASSFLVHGQYNRNESEAEEATIEITHGYSKDHRPDLKQFLVHLLCTSDGDVPLFLKVADGNDSEKTAFVPLFQEFTRQWDFEGIAVADSALYSQVNLPAMGSLRWITRVPSTISAVPELCELLPEECFVASELDGYRLAEVCSGYGEVNQRWLVIESSSRRESALNGLEQQLRQQRKQAEGELKKLMKQDFACAEDAQQSALTLEQGWKYHQFEQLEVVKIVPKKSARKGKSTSQSSYRVSAQLMPQAEAIQPARRRAGRFILATNVLNPDEWSADEVLRTYKNQQSCERGFRFLKDPLFFTSRVFLKTPRRVAALAMVMGLCLLVYSLGQRQLRQNLAAANASLPNQVHKPTQQPTLRWIFQCFQAVHLVVLDGGRQLTNLTAKRIEILRFFGAATQKYYFLC